MEMIYIPVEWQVQTVSENDKDPPEVVVDKLWQEFWMLKMLLDKKSIVLLANWCEQASHYPMETQMLKDAFP